MIKRNAIFLLDKEKGRTDAKVRYRIKWNDCTVAFGLGYRVDVDKWSKETQRVKNNSTHGEKKIAASIINKKIALFESYAEEIFRRFELSNAIPTEKEFRAEFNALNGKVAKALPSEKNSFFDVLNHFTSDVGTANLWTDATYQKFNALKAHIKSFAPDIEFDDLNERGLNAFITHLREKRNLRNTTIDKQIGFLKWFLKWAVRKGYHTQKDFASFSPKLKTSERKVIFLDWTELMTVYNFEIPEHKPSLERVRDVFCFCCFTGLRYSDVANLRRANITATHLSITTIKTNDSIIIELNKYSKAILKKYEDKTFAENKALPVISNQKMNAAIKELAKLCGINTLVTVTHYKGNERIDNVYPKYELIGTHTGRRTFICNALTLGIAPQIVMKWTGHSDYKAMKPYIDIADRAKAEAMKLFDK